MDVSIDGHRPSPSSPARRCSTRPSAPDAGCRRSASTTGWRRSAPAACASSASREHPGRCPRARRSAATGWWSRRPRSAPGGSRGTSSSSCSPSCPSRRPSTRSSRPSRGSSASRSRAGPARRTRPSHDARHPYLVFQHELCISCGRCVRACDEIQGAFALTATGRGFHTNVTAGLDSGFKESSCVSCGACADTCPTDAITERLLVGLADEGTPERGSNG